MGRSLALGVAMEPPWPSTQGSFCFLCFVLGLVLSLVHPNKHGFVQSLGECCPFFPLTD